MPYGQGYGHQGYSGGRGGSSYRYQQATPGQYQSFFKPVPIEFLQQRLEKRQGQYDLSYAGALAGQDELAQTLVGMKDIAGKNEILQESISNMNTTVEEKYGGDWGRASKDIARQITQARANPFWNMAKEADIKRKEAAKFKLENPNAYIFNDPTTKSVLDEEGNLRSAEDFTTDMVKRGDYASTALAIMGKIKADASSFNLTRVEAEGLEHFLKTGQVQGITADKIQQVASDPAVQELFLGQHTEIRRAINELDQGQLERQGLAGKTAEQFAFEQLTGAGTPSIHRQVDLKYQQDPVATAARTTAAKKTATSAYGPQRDLEARPTGFGTSEAGQRRTSRRFFDGDGALVPKLNYMTETEKSEFSRLAAGQPEFDREVMAATKARIAEEIKNHPKTAQLKEMQNLIEDLRKNNPEITAGLNDRQVYEEFHANMDRFTHTIDRSIPILNEDINMKMGASIGSNINATTWYLDSGEKVTDNWNAKKGLGEETGIPAETMQQLLRDGEIPINYNIDRGQHYLEIPIIEDGISKLANGKIDWGKSDSGERKRVYFSPDKKSNGYSKIIQTANQLMKDPENREELADKLSNESNQIVTFDESRFDQRGDVNTQEAFRMQNEEGEWDYFSLNEIRLAYANRSEQHLVTTYGSFE